MAERNFGIPDVVNVIHRGEIISVSYDPGHANWKVEMEGKDLEGEELTVQVALDPEEKIIILITGHSSRFG